MSYVFSLHKALMRSRSELWNLIALKDGVQRAISFIQAVTTESGQITKKGPWTPIERICANNASLPYYSCHDEGEARLESLPQTHFIAQNPADAIFVEPDQEGETF